MSRLHDKYTAEVAPAMMAKFGYKNVMQIPRLEKIVINVGCSEARENAKVLDAVVNDLTTISGQKAVKYGCVSPDVFKDIKVGTKVKCFFDSKKKISYMVPAGKA